MGVCTNRRAHCFKLLLFFFTLSGISNASITKTDVVDKTKDSEETTLNSKDFENAPEKDVDLKMIGIHVPEDPTMGSKAEGDILMPKTKEKKFLDERTGLGRNAIRQSYRKWPNNEIPYTLSTQYGSYSRSVIAKAMNEYHTKTCVRFVPRDTKKHRDYVYIHPDDGCYSLVGRVGGRQPLSLDSGCIQTGTIVHELMHTVGFFHEQSRYDRDHFIEIVWPNVINGADDQFEKYGTNVIDQFNEPYDYSSIMHYGPYAFSANGKRTILARRPGSQKMGQRVQFSEVDLRKINRLYQCDAQTMIKKPPRPQLPIQEVGHFVIQPNGRGFTIHGWNSNQGGEFGTTATLTTTTETSTTTATTTTTTTQAVDTTESAKPSASEEELNEPGRECTDKNWRCAFWSMSVFGYCDKYAEVRDQVCPFSCKTCTPHRSARVPDCVDKSAACARIHDASCESPLTQLLCPRVCGACADAEFLPKPQVPVDDGKPPFFPPPILAEASAVGGEEIRPLGDPVLPARINAQPDAGGHGTEVPGRGTPLQRRNDSVGVERDSGPVNSPNSESTRATAPNQQPVVGVASPGPPPIPAQIDLGAALAVQRPPPATRTQPSDGKGGGVADPRCFDVSEPQICAYVREMQLCAVRLDCARSCHLC